MLEWANDLHPFLLVSTGASIGAYLRYKILRLWQLSAKKWATFTINILATFALGCTYDNGCFIVILL